MQFKSTLLAALAAAGASAQLPTDAVGSSVLLVLATAIPPESISLALANPVSFASELESSISNGDIPPWYQALPSDVKSYLPQLYPAETAALTTPVETSSSTPAPTSTPGASSAASVGSSSTVPINSTVISTVSSATLGSTGGANTGAPTATSAESTGGASLPTAVVGAGAAAVFGFLGMLAL